MKLQHIKDYLTRGLDINSRELMGLALIHNAEDVESTRFLIELGAAADIEDLWGNTALDYAVKDGDLDRVKFLAKITRLPYFDRALGFALKNYTRLDVIQCLVDFMVEIPQSALDGLYELLFSTIFSVSTRDSEDSRAKLEIFKKICAIFNTRKYTLHTPSAHYGVIFLNLPYIKKEWTNFSEEDRVKTAVSACRFNHFEMAEHAIENGVRVEPRMIWLAVNFWSGKVERNLVDYLIEKADADAIESVMSSCIICDRAEVLKIVMTARDMRRSKVRGVPILRYSVMSGARKCFETLLEFGVAPYAVYPKIYKHSLQPVLVGQEDEGDLPDGYINLETAEFFEGDGPRSARRLNAAYSNKMTTR